MAECKHTWDLGHLICTSCGAHGGYKKGMPKVLAMKCSSDGCKADAKVWCGPKGFRCKEHEAQLV